jgi:hypothetical protein
MLLQRAGPEAAAPETPAPNVLCITATPIGPW